MDNLILEPILLTKLSVNAIGKQKPSEIHKLMFLVAKEWGLDIKKQADYNEALEIIKKSVVNN